MKPVATTPASLACIETTLGRFELVEWDWPAIVDFQLTEEVLMLEMSVPPFAEDATAAFPAIAPGEHSFMGTLFIRYPGEEVQGRSKGGRIRVVRCIFSKDAARVIVAPQRPTLGTLHSLLDIRDPALRNLMRMAQAELVHPHARSPEAADAMHRLIAIMLQRLLASQTRSARRGRLAAWQFRLIQDRLMVAGEVPSVAALAKLCGISARHLQRQFHALTGGTVADYIRSFWLERARLLLTTTNMPVKAVAAACGFPHANSFARTFRRAAGLSPTDFRARGGLPRD